MSTDRVDNAEADEDGGGGDEPNDIKALRKTVGGGGCETLSGATDEHEERETRWYHGKRDEENKQ